LATASISTLEDMERQHILRALRQTEWRIAGARGAANILGMKRTTLQARMRKLGIRRPI
jgi:formate hydrogenlyase transcriptional activator